MKKVTGLYALYLRCIEKCITILNLPNLSAESDTGF